MMESEQDYVYTDSIKDLQKRMATMFNNELYCDTIFILSDWDTNQRFLVHSDLVAVASPKLRAIIREHNKHVRLYNVKCHDVKCLESFTVIMKYVYGLDINFSQLKINVLNEAINLAEVYQLNKFSNDLKEFLMGENHKRKCYRIEPEAMMESEQDYIYTGGIKDLQKRLEIMFKNELYCDTLFMFNNVVIDVHADTPCYPLHQSVFHVQSNLVVVASGKLHAIIREHFLTFRHKHIKLYDVKCVESFTVIMKYVYGLDINFSQMKINVLCEAINLAEVYQLNKFFNDLKEFLSKVDKFQLDSLAVLLNTSRKYNLNVLYGKLKVFAFEHAKDFVKHESIVNLQDEILVDLVKSNWFYAPEIDILMGILNWHHRMSIKKTKKSLVKIETNIQNEDINGDASLALKSLLLHVRIKQISRLDQIKHSIPNSLEAYKHILGDNEHFSQTSVLRCNYKNVVGEIKILGYASGNISNEGDGASKAIPEAPYLQDCIHIYIKTFIETFALDVKPSETILRLKVKIEVSKGVRVDSQRLIFEKQQLEDGKCLSDYNIQTESTIFFCMRLRA